MYSSERDFVESYRQRLLLNAIPTYKYITHLNPRYSSSDEHLTPLIRNQTPYLYAKANLFIDTKGVEMRPFNLSLLAKTRQQDTNLVVQMMRVNNMLLSNNNLRNCSVPFHTTTGRTTSIGPSLSSFKKNLWSEVIDPAPGYQYVLLDYMNQEPIISACLASAHEIQAIYRQADLYESMRKHCDLAGLNRGRIKGMLLPHLYGQRSDSYAKEHGIPLAEAQRYWLALAEIFHSVDQELNRRSQLAFKNGFVTCLDWAARVTPLSAPLSVRNWPVQATGADIMRRAVIGLVDAGLDLRLSIHDAFLIRVPVAEHEQQIAKAISVLKQASAMVLDGFELNVKVDGVFDGQAGVM